MPRLRKITTLMLREVPSLIEKGLMANEIASMFGCTPGSLRVMCSKSKISLRRKKSVQSSEPKADGASAPRLFSLCGVDDHAAITIQLPKRTAELLRQEAAAKSLSASTLATTLLKVIAQDGLWDAVLDEDQSSVRRAALPRV